MRTHRSPILSAALALAAATACPIDAARAQTHTITVGSTQLRIQQSPTGFRFVDVSGSGDTYSCSGSALPEDVWMVQFWDANPADKRVVRPSTLPTSVVFSASFASNVFQAQWVNCPIPNSNELFEMHTLIKPHVDGDAIEMECTVLLLASPSAESVFGARFPIMSFERLSGDPQSERLVVPVRDGALYRNPFGDGSATGPVGVIPNPLDPDLVERETAHVSRGTPRQSMQMWALYSVDPRRPRTALFVGTRDPGGYLKYARWNRRGGEVTKADYLEFMHEYIPEDNVVPNNGGRQGYIYQYPVVLAVLPTAGDDRWFDAAEFYRAWVERSSPGGLGVSTVEARNNHLSDTLVFGEAFVNAKAPACPPCVRSIFEHASRNEWTAQLDDVAAYIIPPGEPFRIVHRTTGWAWHGYPGGLYGQWFAPSANYLGEGPAWAALSANQGVSNTHPFVPYFIAHAVHPFTQFHAALGPYFIRDVDGVSPRRAPGSVPKDFCHPETPCTSPQIMGLELDFLCMGEKPARDYTAAHAWFLSSFGSAGGLYNDVFPEHSSMICYSRQHGHPAGGGTWQAQGVRNLLAESKQFGQLADPDFVMLGEFSDELSIGLQDAAILGGEAHNELVPIYDVVYHRYQRTVTADPLHADECSVANAGYATLRYGVAQQAYLGTAINAGVQLPTQNPGFSIANPQCPTLGPVDTFRFNQYMSTAGSQWSAPGAADLRTYVDFVRDVVAHLHGIRDYWLWGERRRDPVTTISVPEVNYLGLPFGAPWVRACAYLRNQKAAVFLTNWTSPGDDCHVPATSINATVTLDPVELGVPQPYRVSYVHPDGSVSPFPGLQNVTGTQTATVMIGNVLNPLAPTRALLIE